MTESRIAVIVVHHERTEAASLANDAIQWLTGRGWSVRVPSPDAAAAGLPAHAMSDDELADGATLALSLGGDGTILRTVDMVAGAGVPVLGVNVGHLGYLTECEPAQMLRCLERFVAGEHVIEERMTIAVDATVQGEKLGPFVALNEAWLEKTEPGHTISLAVQIAGEPFTTYAADGLIVSTPTGSTAYNLSVRGPILSPRLSAMVLKPVSPHQLFDYPLVLHPDEEVGITVCEGRTATLLVDGRRTAVLQAGDTVACRGGPHPARLIRFGDRDFHQILKAKFGLADR